MIDGSVIRAHHHAAGAIGGQEAQGLGRSCGVSVQPLKKFHKNG